MGRGEAPLALDIPADVTHLLHPRKEFLGASYLSPTALSTVLLALPGRSLPQL